LGKYLEGLYCLDPQDNKSSLLEHHDPEDGSKRILETSEATQPT
jgi:hypothetical protein